MKSSKLSSMTRESKPQQKFKVKYITTLAKIIYKNKNHLIETLKNTKKARSSFLI